MTGGYGVDLPLKLVRSINLLVPKMPIFSALPERGAGVHLHST